MKDGKKAVKPRRVRYSLKEVRDSLHAIDSWWTRYFIDPVAVRFTWVFANFTSFPPNGVTLMTLPLIFVSAFFFMRGTRGDLIIGALVYEFSFALDCVDGKLARLTGRTSKLGAFLDLYLDNWNVVINMAALVWGQLRGGFGPALIVAASAYLAIHLLSLLMKFIGRDILGADLKKEFYATDTLKISRGLLGRIRHFFSKRGLNMVLFTTVEGEAAVFFIGPITGYIYESILLSAILVTVFFVLKSVLYFRSCAERDRQG
jgi:phosphatidylglycerophosphate synthase